MCQHVIFSKANCKSMPRKLDFLPLFMRISRKALLMSLCLCQIVNNVRYESLPGFFNRKASEQSAAEVALMKIAESESMEKLSQSVPETGLCKNLLQEYAHKMNIALPRYECRMYDTEGKVITFSCTVEVGGMRYSGAAARIKKKADIKAARTALLAVQSTSLGHNDHSAYTVIPMKKVQENAVALKPKKPKFKKKRKRNVSDASNQVHRRNTGDSQVEKVNQGTESGPAPLAATMVAPVTPSSTPLVYQRFTHGRFKEIRK